MSNVLHNFNYYRSGIYRLHHLKWPCLTRFTDAGDGLVPSRQQAITWTSVNQDPIYGITWPQWVDWYFTLTAILSQTFAKVIYQMLFINMRFILTFSYSKSVLSIWCSLSYGINYLSCKVTHNKVVFEPFMPPSLYDPILIERQSFQV